MKSKKIGILLSIAVAAVFTACNDDSSPASAPAGDDHETITSSSDADSPKSSSSVEKADNGDSNKEEGNKDDSGKDDSSKDDSSKDDSSKDDSGKGDSNKDEGSKDEPNKNENVDKPVQTPDSSMVNLDSLFNNIDTTGFGTIMDQFQNMPECTEANEGEKTTMTMMGMDVEYICKNGEWGIDNSCADGDSKEVMGVALVCKDGEWQQGDNSCSEEGATKEVDSGFGMKFTYVCKNGEWAMDMGDFGGWGAGDSSSTGWGNGSWGGFGDSSATGGFGGWGAGDSSSTGWGNGNWNLGDSTLTGGFGNIGGDAEITPVPGVEPLTE